MEGLRSEDPQEVGPYRLLARLGQGAMAQVYLGQSGGGRLAAVKVISPALTADPDFRIRFQRELDAARRVSSAFITPIVDADTDSPLPWLASDYVAGPSLADAVADYGPMPAATVLALAAGLAEGLGAVHAAGVVHRSLKPSNVLLARDGPRIVDFGISLVMAEATVTGSGMFIATPAFMSPEQAVGGPVGTPCDIFSLGSVLVFAATGEGPFGMGEGNEGIQVLYRVVYSQPAIQDVPMEVRSIVEHCLAKDAQLRPTADQVLAEVGTGQFSAGWLPVNLSNKLLKYEAAVDSRGVYEFLTAANPIVPKVLAGHAFISYVREDSCQVDEMQRMLEEAGIPVWRDTADLWPGEDWRIKIRRAITDNALVFIACFSKSSLSRGKSYQNEELTLAIEQLRLRSPDDPWLIPVRLDECEIPDRDIGGGRTLNSIQRSDLFGDRSEEGNKRLVAAILRILG
jgi:serine/threonine protein kinase